MILGKVMVPVVSSAKNKSLNGLKIFVIQPLNENLQPATGSSGAVFLALDHVQAGEGDIVLVSREGNGCRQMLADDGAPVNAVISAIVDQVQSPA
jgi:ethanolamine utilization protein EutN